MGQAQELLLQPPGMPGNGGIERIVKDGYIVGVGQAHEPFYYQDQPTVGFQGLPMFHVLRVNEGYPIQCFVFPDVFLNEDDPIGHHRKIQGAHPGLYSGLLHPPNIHLFPYDAKEGKLQVTSGSQKQYDGTTFAIFPWRMRNHGRAYQDVFLKLRHIETKDGEYSLAGLPFDTKVKFEGFRRVFFPGAEQIEKLVEQWLASQHVFYKYNPAKGQREDEANLRLDSVDEASKLILELIKDRFGLKF